MKELLKILNKKTYILLLITGIICSLAQSAESLALANFSTSPLDETKMMYLIISFAICELVMWGANWGNSYVANFVSAKSKTNIKKYYFKKIEKMPSKKLTNVHTGYFQNLISDVAELFDYTMWIFTCDVIGVIIGVATFAFMACRQSILTGIICIILFIFAILCKYKMLKNRQKYDKQTRAKRSESEATFIDFVQNIITVKKLNIRKFCLDKIQSKNDEYIKSTKKNEVKRANMNLIFHLIISAVYIVVLISTLIMIKNGEDALPYLLFYMNLLGSISSKISGVANFMDTYIKFKTAKSQLDEKIGELKDLKLIKSFNKVELVDSEFQYNENSVKISIPNFVLKKGDKISIVGESGQGKSTAMNILAGLYELKNGKLLIDGKKNNNSKLDLVFVSQEVDLFDISIKENLCLGKDIPEEKILNLLEDAGLTEWYNNLENGLDTLVGEKGIKLSAGQKQRLNLIRGILIDKDLYFFDEPTSNLDSVSEEKITNMIEKYLNDKTYVIVTHRPRLEKLCNKHYVMKDHVLEECESDFVF